MAHFPQLRWRMANPEHGDMVAIIGVNLAVGEGNRRARLVPPSPPRKARPRPASQAAQVAFAAPPGVARRSFRRLQPPAPPPPATPPDADLAPCAPTWHESP